MKTKKNKYLNLYFQVHQPRRLRNFGFFDIGNRGSYFDDPLNRILMERIALNGYLATNNLLLRLIKKHPNIRITFSISGTALEQLESYAPKVLDSFKKLNQTGAIEFLGETYYHSLASIMDPQEFKDQVKLHSEKIVALFGVKPTFFRNTELIYSDAIGELVNELDFKGIYVDGINNVLHGRSSNKVYKHPTNDLVIIPRNFSLSDDISFRFSDKNWSQWPLTAKKYIKWLVGTPIEDNIISLGMDYETFGEHHKKSSGITKFLKGLLSELAEDNVITYANPADIIKSFVPVDILSTEKAISWADGERDLSAWLGNDMQQDAFENLSRLLRLILATGDKSLLHDYRYLQTSDNLYYMCTKGGNDGEVHKYFSPYSSPYEAFMIFMNVIADFEIGIKFMLRAAQLHRLSKNEAKSNGIRTTRKMATSKKLLKLNRKSHGSIL